MLCGNFVKIIGLRVDCFETNIVTERNVDAKEVQKNMRELHGKYPGAVLITVQCNYQVNR